MGSSWREHADVPEAVREQLPRGYDVVGDVAIVRLPEDLDEHLDAIGEALVEAVPPAETAAVDRGVEGALRTRRLEVLAGSGDLVTLQKENGCRLTVDLEKTYFSPRLAHERGRVADAVREGEHVLDMYCGVGPYAVLVAKRGARVIAVDANPRAVELARDNAAANKVADRVRVLVGDAEQVVPALEGTFDRIVMNLPHTAREHLDAALSALAEDGTIHLGAMLPKDDADEEARAIAREHGLELVDLVDVRPYNPAVGHYTLDLQR